MRTEKSFICRIFAVVFAFCALFFVSGCEDESIKILFQNYEKAGGNIGNLKTLAVLDLEGRGTVNGEEISGEISESLRRMGYIRIIDSKTAREVLQSKGLPVGGIISDDDAAQICRALNVDGVIYGKGWGNFRSEIRYNEYYDSPAYYGPLRCRYRYFRRLYRTPYLNRSGKVVLELHFFDGKLGKEMGVINLSKLYNQDFKDYYYSAVSPGEPFFFDMGLRNPMPSDHDMVLHMTQRLADNLLDGFTAYYISKTRALQEGVSGIDYIKEEKWDRAAKIWQEELKKSPDWRLNVNLGIYYEREGNPARAVPYYQEAALLNPGDEILKKYEGEAAQAARIRQACMFINVAGANIYRISDIKEDGRIYINTGIENNCRNDDIYIIVRRTLVFDKDLVTPQGYRYLPVAEIKIEKVFEGVSWGRLIPSDYMGAPAVGDGAVKK